MRLGAELDSYPSFAAALAASAQTALRHGRWAEARELVTAARSCASELTESLPWLAVGVRLELAECYLTLRDVDAARELVAELDEILETRPDLGVLVDRAQELRQTLGEITEERKLGLTPAEDRLLPLLATHLSFREIAEELHVSRNTVKTQAISIYRKLGVSGRSDAIAVARRRDPSAVAA
jgi:LuxR family maltose regulon positive regulatory protein